MNQLKKTAILIFLPIILAGCSSKLEKDIHDVDARIVHSVKRYKKVYVLGLGDVIEVLVQRNPTASRTVSIRSDGFISLPLIGDIKAAGSTFEELDTRLTEEFSKRLKDPEVNILSVDLRPPAAFVVGEVNAPRPVLLREAHTAALAVAACGGFKKTAAGGAVSVIRMEADGRLAAIPLTLGSRSQPAPFMAMQQFQLQADDILVIPESSRAQFGRIVDDFLNKPLSGVNSVLSMWTNYRLIEELNEN